MQGCQIYRYNIPKGGKSILIATKLLNGRKMYQMAAVCSKMAKEYFSIPWPSKIYPNWDFWFENKPSGNPAFMY
jgi:hypothetical protein